jgi:hypothetical protein
VRFFAADGAVKSDGSGGGEDIFVIASFIPKSDV